VVLHYTELALQLCCLMHAVDPFI